ncbi:hypothetical protein FBEOM_13253 [Fusarium beomiforme]|uniref:Uncharacterized protein n=1 Tax=Fusarium beomiforme TaxID=44412 RepID=A0A9P5DRR4_9HYPO|nr:hypothetical protein FBEOM_13253 [Fusarium beomiforme]
MNQERREQIAAALRQYRETPAPPNCPESVTQGLRMRAIQKLIEVPESITSPRDVLDEGVISSLISSASLEGIDDDPVDPSQRREYFAGVKASIEETGVEIAEFPPSDLEYLCNLVSGITGPGLPFHQEACQFDFISPLPLDHSLMKDMMKTVCVPIRNNGGQEEYNELTYIWGEWEIAIAFKIGGGPRGWGGSYALYCRNDNKEWKWRYGVHDEDWYSDVYENVEEFLGFYAHFNEKTKEELKDGITSLSALL